MAGGMGRLSPIFATSPRLRHTWRASDYRPDGKML